MMKKFKKFMAITLIFAVCIGIFDVKAFAQEVEKEEETEIELVQDTGEDEATENIYETENFNVKFSLDSVWDTGYNATITIENVGDRTIENWYLEFPFNNKIENIWNAEVYSCEEGEFCIIKNDGWNADIPVGETVQFGFSCNENFVDFPQMYSMSVNIIEKNDTDYSIEYMTDSDWGSGFSGRIIIFNNSEKDIEDWKIEFDFDRKISSIWNAVVETHEGNHYVIKNNGYNANIAVGMSVTFGFVGEDGVSGAVPENYFISSYEYNNRDSVEQDTDKDGLNNFQELNFTGTDPLLWDSDKNGIGDGEEDIDEDGLSNFDEMGYETDPLLGDTDGDCLGDSEEIIEYNTDPLEPDTDKDGLTDYDDIILGFSPLLMDTDGNGILDADEKLEQNVVRDFKNTGGRGITAVCVSLLVSGNAEKEVLISNTYGEDVLSSQITGLVGVPIEINTNKSFENAEITFHYDETMLGNVKEEDLAVLWYNEANNWYQILDEECVIDTENNKVSYVTSHFSTYMLVDSKAWFEAWRENIDYRNSEQGDEKHYFDIVFVVDVSGSMRGSYIDNTKEALHHFSDSMQSNDEAALVCFSAEAYTMCRFTNESSKLKKAINALDAGGGTNVNSGLLSALSLFRNKDSNNKKIVVLICDGDVNYTQSTIDSYVRENIQIYAVNVASASAHTYLQKMTEQTGGEYYYGTSANDIIGMFSQIQGGTVEQIDPTDTDEDGLYDIYETAGMRLPNGQIVHTDPAHADTDGDGLTDYEETGIIYNVDNRYIGDGNFSGVKYFILRSDPTRKDTDSDGINDNKDPWPLWKHALSQLENYYTRDVWGATPLDYTDQSLEEIGVPSAYYDTIVVHHSARNQYEDIKKLEKNEKKDGFNGIPYHFVVDGYGNIYECRPINYKGSHVANNNTGKIGVSLMGNFHPEADDVVQWLKGAMPTSPTYAQYNAMIELIKVLDTQYGTDYLGGHRDFVVVEKNTVCPGDTLYGLLKRDNMIVLP